MSIIWFNKEGQKLSSVKVVDKSHLDYYLVDFVNQIKFAVCEGDCIMIKEEATENE